MGQYRIDIVVSDESGQVALECDEDRFHAVDQIPTDMARQAVLERAGWRFVRVRGTRYYRDQEATTRWVVGELERMNVRPLSDAGSPTGFDGGSDEFHVAVKRRAWEIMREQGWIDPVSGAQDRDLE